MIDNLIGEIENVAHEFEDRTSVFNRVIQELRRYLVMGGEDVGDVG